MTAKPTGLAAFTRKPRIDQTSGSQEQLTPPETRTRAKNASVALTVRLTRQQWERLHQLALADGVSLQQLIVLSLGSLFRSRGLPEL